MRVANKVIGTAWENTIETINKYTGWHTIRIPDGCKRIKDGFIPVKSPFDFIFTKDNTIVFADAKTTMDSTYSYSKINQDQLRNLALLEYKGGAIAGYLVYFRKHDAVVFFKSSQLIQLRGSSSIQIDNGVLLGGLHNFRLDILKHD